MRCDEARAALSAVLDRGASEAEAAGAASHAAGCDACAAFEHDIVGIRRALRFERLDVVPDVAAVVARRLREARPPRRAGLSWAQVAAAFVAGAVVGAVVIGIDRDGPGDIAAADIPSQVLAAQRDIESLQAKFSLVERGWHADVARRTYRGTLSYEAPESLALELRDTTSYPSPAWVPNDMALVVREDVSWTKGVRACPAEALPACTPVEPLVQASVDREPFAEALPVPLDLVTPVQSLGLAASPELVASRRIAGRPTVGVVGTASQFSPLLDALRAAGNGREVHPGDRTEVWLDRETLVPLAVRVFAGDDWLRVRWAAARGYQDDTDELILELTVSEVAVDRRSPANAFPSVPAGVVPQDHGFVKTSAEDTGVPQPAWLPAGFSPHREGTIGGNIGVRTWTDGRAWLRIDATRAWLGGRLFGDVGPLVRLVDLGDAGVGYVSEDGGRVGVHGDGADVVVTGSLPPADLMRVASALGVSGGRVPGDWLEASTTTLTRATTAHPRLLVPTGLAGFAPPAVRSTDDVVTLSYAGPGSRGFVLTQTEGSELTPPLDPDTFGFTLRQRDGRYSPDRHELEWREGDRTISLRSTTLSVEELIAIAEGLRAR